jgi:[ribosomal protein S5]-alanine N-acetyltransferase
MAGDGRSGHPPGHREPDCHLSAARQTRLQRADLVGTVVVVDLNAAVRTKRLFLRPVQQGDLPALTELRSNPEVVRYLPQPSAPGPEEIAKALRAEMDLVASGGETLLWGIQRHRDPTLIGHIAVWPRGDDEITRGELIIAVVPSVWRQGIATEACTAAMTRWLQQFPGSTIYAAAHPENVACHALMRKLGLEHEIEGRQFPGIHAGTDRVFFRPLISVTARP